MKTYYFLFFIYLNLSAFGQKSPSQDWIKVLSYGVGNQSDEKKISLEEAAQRTEQCIPTDFTYANLILSNNDTIENVLIKYDFNEIVLLIRMDNHVVVGAPNVVRRIQFQNSETLELINVQELGRSYGRRGFYSVLLKRSDSYLLKYESFEQREAMPNSSVSSTDVYAPQEEEPEFSSKEEILISKDQELFVLENFKSKTLLKFDQQSALKTYIKTEKLKFKNEEDLKKFANYFWSL